MPGVCHTCKHSTEKPKQIMQKSTTSFYTENENNQVEVWRIPSLPASSLWQQAWGSLYLPSQLTHSRHRIARLCHTSFARLIPSHLDNELYCSLDSKAASGLVAEALLIHYSKRLFHRIHLDPLLGSHWKTLWKPFSYGSWTSWSLGVPSNSRYSMIQCYGQLK